MTNSTWYLYVLRCGDGSLYTGVTTDLDRRLAEHQAGQGARYTRAHLPVSLGGAWRYPHRSVAQSAEHAFKALPRAVKLSWLEGRWPFQGGPYAFERFDGDARYRFCPRCGGRLDPQAVHGGEVLACEVCGRRHYANAKPAAGVLIVREGRVLLVRRSLEPYLGYWDIPGGFLDEEEDPETGAVREAREETGLEVRLMDFLGFYMDHYDFQGERYAILNIYFVAKAEGEPQPGDDADACRWFPLDALPERIAFPHAHEVLRDLRTWTKG
jgi:ADP-ribose pyrophosphatase YjhB (NUDIX family)/predicted GIY-YIG superfamily endonuclease